MVLNHALGMTLWHAEVREADSLTYGICRELFTEGVRFGTESRLPESK
jgi:hypothetical protein